MNHFSVNHSPRINPRRYYAFISYQRKDEKWANWLQHKLEHYRLPSNLNGLSNLPKQIRPVFKDTVELIPGNLPEQIRESLLQSQYLIVICSPNSAKSEWVNKEIETFIAEGRTQKILPFIVDGRPFSPDPEEECFPSALKGLPPEREILGANIGENGRDAAAVKIIASMFGLQFDVLWRRHEREKRIKRLSLSLLLILLAITAILVAVVFFRQSQQLKHQTILLKSRQDKILANQSRYVSEEANRLSDYGDYLLSRKLALSVLPTDLSHPDRPYVPEAEAALRRAWDEQNSMFVWGHTKRVFSIKCSHDGKTIAISTEDGLFIGNLNSGKVSSLNSGTASYDCSFSPDDLQIASVQRDSTVCLWDIQSERIIHSTHINYGIPTTVSYCPKGNSILVGLDSGIVSLLDTASGKEVYSFPYNKAPIISVCFLPDGSQFVSGSYDGFVRKWDISSGDFLWERQLNPGIRSLSVSPNGLYLSSCDNMGSIYSLNTQDGATLWSKYGHSSIACASVFSPDSNSIASCSWDGSLRFWDTKTGEEFYSYSGGVLLMTSLSYYPDGTHVITGSVNGEIRIWESPEEVLLNDYVVSIDISHDGNKIVSGSLYGYICNWDRNSLEEIAFTAAESDISAVSYSPDGTLLAAGFYNGTIWILDAVSHSLLHELKNLCVSALSFSPDGRYLASGSDVDRAITIWDVSSGQVIQRFDNGNPYVSSLAYSPDGNYITFGTDDRLLYVWDIKTQDAVILDGHSWRIQTVTFSSDGKRIASGAGDGTIIIWDVTNGEVLDRFENGTLFASSLSFSPNGHYLLAGFVDGSKALEEDDLYPGVIRIWDITSTQARLVFSCNNKGYNPVAFLPDGNHFISGQSDGSIRIWDFPPLQELINETSKLYQEAPLTAEQRRKYYLE